MENENQKIMFESFENAIVRALKRTIRYSMVLALAYMVGFVIYDKLNPPAFDSTDSAEDRSGMSLHTDALTGCQYLSSGDGITPRLNAQGEQLGCKK